VLFGLCDLGMGSPELSSVSRAELEEVRGRFGLPLEREVHRRQAAFGPRRDGARAREDRDVTTNAGLAINPDDLHWRSSGIASK
jgi:Protein of unknown function (DUF2958)